ncbi:MAG: thiamine biosynthesis protein ThiF [Bacteroidetes bacterium GWE2_39_28]|nr:MAG: thiamine biosynthesis protein ThiF [Bacteroidetes bacterium GWE2_39_28]OFY12212.1 MAG: thiamine biosynthesis protein ThiF [Bacteroidetes bacterium GWF2_39_10]OFZ07947.1 MAG: thiamine biosynthesis protein ThiF [Bacteroidetes bacterium RIFOXYB2_FULL_39_7]OFZ12310.1 MAG: thiamine biosynthesis protein ThiF [Bacteroidetes bacterium RIFOXYC2_FULL_39_11]HCT94242.1 sulfur carrier protein ThiS adenylyltransferase ThiF [Rikenellaceae bacterium]
MPTFNQIKAILSQKTVGIAGAGGLGSNCAVSLIRSGVGKLIVADYDRVSPENLNRQFYFRKQSGMKKVDALRENLQKICPGCLLQMHDTWVTKDNIELLFSVCDVVVEAFDEADQKSMLIEYMLTNLPDIPLVAASGMAGFGRTDQLKVVQSGNLYVCGDAQSEISEENPPLAPRVNIVANMQADIVLQLLLKDVV